MTSTSTKPSSNEPSKESIDGIRASAVAVWPNQDGSPSFHDQLSLYIRHNAPSRAAFFSLRTNVSLKDRASAKGKADRWLYLQIPPECIRNLSLDFVDGSSPDDYRTDEHSEVAKRLNANPTNIVCLRFDLNQPCRLVVPEGQLVPKNKHSGELVDLHMAAARQNQLRVYAQLPDRLVSRSSLSALCTAACNAGLISIVQDAKISGLYGGKDGRILDVATGATSLESPPSYDQLEPGPPMPPLEPEGSSAGKKRQRCNSDGASEWKPVNVATLASQVEEMSQGIKSGLAQLMDQVNHMKKETGIRLDKLEEQMSRVEAQTNSRIDDLETELRSRIDFMEAGSTQSESETPLDSHQTGSQLRTDLERQIDDTRTDLMNEVHDLESEMRETREFLEDGGLEDRIRDILDGARFSIHT